MATFIYIITFCLSILISSTTSQDQTCSEKRDSVSSNGLLGAPVPRCDENGDYQPMQCIGSICHCVDWEGNKIGSYQAPIHLSSKMNCKCARDQDEYRKTKLLGKMFHCKSNGNYEPVQCTGSVCYCADENGQQRVDSDGIHISKMQTLKCE